ncbi:hypothetical protein RISK_003739 [Rhodopirellula islandica]|uniref:Uncharacterized protein n=1 Tax=Rhodopirellula islandica TaxID=595434 RepID=A0A0J1BC79_RHOIS|nr:hypothetical protein RISK_003739 [Rhodopirellula islandica]
MAKSASQRVRRGTSAHPETPLPCFSVGKERDHDAQRELHH